MEKTGNNNMTPSEESITWMTFNVSLNTVVDPSHSFRMTINVPPHYDDFHATVILNGDKNAL